MRSRKKHSTGFTLIELLIVVTIMSILVGVGSPALFKASRIYRFRNETAVIKEMMDEMRVGALNSLAIPSSASAIPSAACPGGGYDTNFDGICGDTVPFSYVFEIIFDGNARLSTLRTYARFSEDQFFGADDISLSEKSFNTAYDVVIRTRATPAVPSVPNYVLRDRTFAFSFAPVTQETGIWRYKGTTEINNLHMVGITVSSDEVANDFQMVMDKTSGIPSEVDSIDF